jgi:acetyl esterase/lipase
MTRVFFALLLLQAALLQPALSQQAAEKHAGVTPDDLLKEQVGAADQRLAYGAEALQFGELRLPSGKGPYPVVVLVHGGCWSDHLPGLDPRATAMDLLRPMAAALTSAGMATWNVEYRRNLNPGGGWPGTFQDLSRATDFLRTIAAKYNLDLKRVVVAGHSSGGQLALWLAARPKIPASSALYSENPLPLKGAVDIDGPIDLASVQPMEQQVCDIPAITQFLGGTPAEQPARYRESTIASYLPTGVPQVLIAGALLERLLKNADEYASQTKAAGDSFRIIKLEGSNHFAMLSPKSPYWPTVRDTISSLLR